MGRPSTYSGKVADAICERIANGETLSSVCRDPAMPARSTVNKWVADDIEGFSANYARAREAGFDALADELVRIADGQLPTVEVDDSEAGRGTDSQRDRLRVDTRKWLLSKWSKRYADKTVLAGDPDAPLQIAEIRRTVVDGK